MITFTSNTTAVNSGFIHVTFMIGPPPEPPSAGQPARVTPHLPGGPPVLNAARAPDGTWEVPARHASAELERLR